MNKIINLLSFLLIINLLILGNLLLKKYTHETILPISYAKDVMHNNDNYNLILKILKDTNNDNLIKYADYIEISVTDEIPNDNKNKVAFTLSLPEQISFIAIYDKIDNNNLKFQCSINNLALVSNFYFYKDFLIIEQKDSNSSDNISQREFFEIFYKKDNKYISVFNKSIYSEELNKKENSDNLIKNIETSSIDYLEGSIPRILCITTITEYEGSQSSEEFNEINKNTMKEIYKWDDKNEKFIKSTSENINK